MISPMMPAIDLRSVSSEVAEETNQRTKVSAQVKHMMSAEVDDVLHD